MPINSPQKKKELHSFLADCSFLLSFIVSDRNMKCFGVEAKYEDFVGDLHTSCCEIWNFLSREFKFWVNKTTVSVLTEHALIFNSLLHNFGRNGKIKKKVILLQVKPQEVLFSVSQQPGWDSINKLKRLLWSHWAKISILPINGKCFLWNNCGGWFVCFFWWHRSWSEKWFRSKHVKLAYSNSNGKISWRSNFTSGPQKTHSCIYLSSYWLLQQHVHRSALKVHLHHSLHHSVRIFHYGNNVTPSSLPPVPL